MSTICAAAEEIILSDFRSAIRKQVLDDAVENYRQRITPIVDQALKTVVDARVEAVRDILGGKTDLNINLRVE